MIALVNGEIRTDILQKEWKCQGAIYEVLRVAQGKPLFLKEHLLRMQKTLPTLNAELVTEWVLKLIKIVDPAINQNIFLSYKPQTSELAEFFVESVYPPKQWYTEGIDSNILKITRSDPTKKVYDTVYKEFVANHLLKTGVFETLIADENTLMEGSRSNVFFIKQDVLITPPVGEVLPGITRDKVLEIAKELKIEIQERRILIEEISQFQGAFITGTSIDLLPIRKIDANMYSTGSLPAYQSLNLQYQEAKKNDAAQYK